MTTNLSKPRDGASLIAVVIPSYKVKKHIVDVVKTIGQSVGLIFVIDDCCPERSGDHLLSHIQDPRVQVLIHSENQGVGGAVMTGYMAAINAGADVIVKIDGDGQMDPDLIDSFVAPILAGEADYTKGNRFWDLRQIRSMPALRRFGNLVLSFFSKLSTGYWDIFDPTNGFTAIHARVAENLPFEAISKRYFFESDMLFRLNTFRAVVIDVPMHSKYSDEVSNLNVGKVLPEFFIKNTRNFAKRIAYNYFLRDLSLASLELVFGVLLIAFGASWGGWHWFKVIGGSSPTPVGTIMICTVAIISGLQFLLAFIGYDIANVPRRSLHALLQRRMPKGRLNTARGSFGK